LSDETRLTGDALWKGQIRVDESFDDYVTNISDLTDSKQYTIRDVKYHHEIYSHIPGIGDLGFPYSLTIILEGKELSDTMDCVAANWYDLVEKTRGLIRKEKYYEKRIRARGFKMRKSSSSQTNLPCLASYRGFLGKDNSFSISQKGLVCFMSGSQSGPYTDTAAYKSVTCLFVASNEKPFVASVRKKGKIFNVICDSDGIREESQDVKEPDKPKKPKPKDDPLAVLKLRLAKGEITKEEYEDLRKTLEE